MLKQFTLGEKKVTFNRVKMHMIMDFQEKMQEINKKKGLSAKEKQLEIGKAVQPILKDFKPEDTHELEPDDWTLLQQLNLIYMFLKTKRSEEEIEDLKARIVDSSIEGQLAFMKNPVSFQD